MATPLLGWVRFEKLPPSKTEINGVVMICVAAEIDELEGVLQSTSIVQYLT